MKAAARILLLTLMILPFQNCSPFHAAESAVDLSSSGEVAGTQAEMFSKTLQPFLRTNCAGCHGASQNPKFAVADAASASNTIFENNLVDFANPANSRFVQKINGGHNGFPLAWANEIQTRVTAWADAGGRDPSAVDVEAPAVMLSSPNVNQIVSGMFSATAIATDNVGVAGVQFLIDGVAVGAEDTVAPFSVSINSATLTNASHAVSALARDAAGNSTASPTVTFSVNNTSVVDAVLPTSMITSHANGATIAGTVMVTASASDNVGVVGVQFLVDNVAVGTEDTAAPYSYSLNSMTLTNGSHTLRARARDAAGNLGLSAIVTVTVNSPVPNPNATYTYLATNVFVPKCVGCHGNNGDAGVSLNSYAGARARVSPGNPNGSLLYNVSKPGGSMPPSAANKLSATQLQALSEWITAGAPNN